MKEMLYTVEAIRGACRGVACGYNGGVFCETAKGGTYKVLGAALSEGVLVVEAVVGTTNWVLAVLVGYWFVR